MVRVETDRSGWSTVQDPETGERVPLGEDGVDPDVAERLADAYGPVEVVNGDGDDSDDTDEDSDGDTTDDTDGESATYDREELEEMEYGELQTLAADADTDAVDGRSSRADIVEALSDDE